MRIVNLLAAVLPVSAGPASAQAVTVPPFESVALRNGGEVIVRHGTAQRVTFRQGDPRRNSVRVADGRLVIDHCSGGCSRGEKLVVEIVTPRLAAVSVSDGGLLEVRGGFPAQDTFAAAVTSGGAIDLRAFAAARVTASVAQGGLIFVRPGARLDASVTQGGRITYWGSPLVRSTVRHGGVVARGTRADAGRPFAALHPNPPRTPAIPPLGN